MELNASASGKLFVLGEYAVTTGAPAIACATERRLECRLSARRGSGRTEIRLGNGEHFVCPPDLEQPAQVPQEFRFAVTAAEVARRKTALTDLDITLAASDTLDQGTPKVGLGGSAAITAAILAGFAELPGASHLKDLRNRTTLGIQAHRLAQGGGSGADVAAITAGGLTCISGIGNGPPPTTIAEACEIHLPALTVERLELPAGIHLRALATGRPARSGPRASHFRALLQGRGTLGTPIAEGLRAWTLAMHRATDDFREACVNNREAGALNAVHRGAALFSRLPVLSGIPVWSPELRRLSRACAGQQDVAIKPSGAGGGDCAIALVRAPEGSFWQKDPVINSLASVGLRTTGSGACAQVENSG